MTITTVALTDTFDVWRTRTNQLVTQSNYYETNLPTYATLAGANTDVGAGANAFSAATISGANSAVGAGANSYANVVWARANSRMDSLSTLTGTEANNFTKATLNGANTAVGDGANNFTKATLAGANTAVGNGANNFFKATMNGANADARIANNLTSGVVPFARLSGSYTSIIGVGTIDTGTWNATNIALNKGGTNASLTASAGAVAYSTASALALSGVGASGSVLTSAGTSAPTWTIQSSLQVGYATVAGSAGSATTAGTVTTAAQPSITSVGTLTSLAVSGTITAGGDITAFSSDARLKGDIQTITNALSKVKLITGITYKHNDLAKSFGYTDENRFAGVLAQEVEVVLPEVVVPAPFDVADDGTSKSGKNYKTVKYEKIVPLLIEAIKELTAKVEMLESKAGK
jgi:hypothetical protein